VRVPWYLIGLAWAHLWIWAAGGWERDPQFTIRSAVSFLILGGSLGALITYGLMR
jgi:hypothetical protein